jgi:hypothetical protein
MDETIDYQGLFEVMRKENERLRMQIVGLKDRGYTIKDQIGEMWGRCTEHPLFVLYVFMGISILFQLISFLASWLKGNNREE